MSKRRITLFIEFSGEPDDDELLAIHTAEALANRFYSNQGPFDTGDVSFSPGLASVNNIKVAVGETHWCDIIWDHGYQIRVRSTGQIIKAKKP